MWRSNPPRRASPCSSEVGWCWWPEESSTSRCSGFGLTSLEEGCREPLGFRQEVPPSIPFALQDLRGGDDGEVLRTDLLQLVPRHGPGHAGGRAGPRRIRGGHMLPWHVSTGVQQHPAGQGD